MEEPAGPSEDVIKKSPVDGSDQSALKKQAEPTVPDHAETATASEVSPSMEEKGEKADVDNRYILATRRHREPDNGTATEAEDDATDKLRSNDSQGRLAVAEFAQMRSESLGAEQTEEPGSTDRLRELIAGGESGGESHSMLFCELQELQECEWHEKARWVRFEEDVEEGGGRWSKPFVATLSLHSTLELRRNLSSGTILLDFEARSLKDLLARIADALIANNHLDASARKDFMRTMQMQHIHQHEQAENILKRGINEIGKKLTHDETPSGIMGAQLASGLGASASLVGGIAGLSGIAGLPIPVPQHVMREESVHKQNEHFAKKLAPGTEAAATLVAGVDFLDHVVSVFVRLSKTLVLDDLTEVSVPTRFIYIQIGPSACAKDYHEIGRVMSTIMSDDIFRSVAYRARDVADLLTGLDEFVDEVTILPPGEWDPTIRIDPPKSVPTEGARKLSALKDITEETMEQVETMEPVASSSYLHQEGLVMKAVSTSGAEPGEGFHSSPGTSALDLVLKKQSEKDEAEEGAGAGHVIDPTLQRTGHMFGGLVADIKRKIPFLRSDITDALNVQCVASVFYLFFACLAPIVTFGGLLGLATANNMAAFESILTGAICGTTYHLFAGQPITIIGSTGPVLLFEKIIFDFSKDNDMNYLTLRFWVGIWTAATMLILVAFDLSALVQLITRFTEECFATLISVIFIFEAFVALHGIYVENPISSTANVAQNFTCICEFDKTYKNMSSAVCRKANLTACTSFLQCRKAGPGCDIQRPIADVFFFSVLLCLGTCGISFTLKNFRTSPFFPNKFRSCLSDFSVSISIFMMVALDFFTDLPTPKLTVPQEFKPTRADREWLVNPFANPVWTIFATPFPAILLSVLLFMDQQITAVIVNRREHKLVKGKGYHLDLLVLCVHIVICAFFGLPYFVAATVLSITHVNSLRKESETSAPGEQPKFLGLIEQRVTGFMVFVLIGCAIPLRAILKFIPMPVLYGVFLYMGLAALQTSQFYNRCILVFMPVKYQPDAPYLRHMRTWRVHLFTALQLTAFIVLWVVKQIKQISIFFVLMLVIMVLLRKLLDFVFTQDELRWVDDILPKNPLAVPKKEESKSQTHMSADGKDKAKSSTASVRSPGPGTESEKQPMTTESVRENATTQV